MSCSERILQRSLKLAITWKKKISKKNETEKPKTKRTKNSRPSIKRWLNKQKNNKSVKV